MSPPPASGRGSRSATRRTLSSLRKRLTGGGTTRTSRPRPTDGGLDKPPPPPVCPPGWRTGPPDFVGIGVQRCGTTRWFDLLSSHPSVVRPVAAKELHYFDNFYEGGFGEQAKARYYEYFPRPEGARVGEWTPLYASAPWVPRLLAEAAPEARLLILLRDPVERYRSGLELDAGVAARRGAPLSRYAPLEAFMRGRYHAQLEHVLKYFDRSRLLILQYERCTSEPREQLRRTFEFLGLEDSDAPDLEAHPKHQPEKPQLDPETRAAYVRAYEDDVLALTKSFPEVDLSLWPNFTHLAPPATPPQ